MFDALSFINKWENEGDLSQDDMLEGFQGLLDTGTLWHLQGSYGRTAAALLEAGLIHYKGDN